MISTKRPEITCNLWYAPYKPQEYFQAVRGLEKEPEGGDRCKACFDYRLDMVAKKQLNWVLIILGAH